MKRETPGRRQGRRNRHAEDLAWIRIWYLKAQLAFSSSSADADWLEEFGEMCARLERYFELEDTALPPLSMILLDAREDLRSGLLPTWLRPRVMANHPPPSRRQTILRGVLADGVECLKQLFGHSERGACKKVAEALPGEVSEDQIEAG